MSIARIREALADPALFDEGASVDDTLRAFERWRAAWDEWRNKHAHCILAMLHGFETLIDRDDEPTRALLDRLDAAEREAALRAEVEALKADLSTYMQAANEHLADAEALRKLQAGEAYKAADYLRACADAKPVAWMHIDGRVISAATMDQAHRDGGAMQSSLRDYTIPLYAHSAPAVPQAEPKPTPASGNDLNVYKEMATNYRNDAQAEPKREPLHELPPLPEPGAYAYEWRLQTGSVYRSFSARHYNGVPCDDQVLFFTADQMREYARTVLRTHGIGGSDE